MEFLLNAVDRIIVMDGNPSQNGFVKKICDKEEGMLELMEKFELSYRRDILTKRLKLNKKGSKKDLTKFFSVIYSINTIEIIEIGTI